MYRKGWKKFPKKYLVALSVFALVALILIIVSNENVYPEDEICFKERCFDVDIADSFQERQTGLMFVENLDENKGMWFVFPEESIYGFWMKNTLISLDIIWVDDEFSVVYIEHDAQPCKTEMCPTIDPGEMALYVLEINGGIAKEIGLEVGDSVEWKKSML